MNIYRLYIYIMHIWRFVWNITQWCLVFCSKKGGMYGHVSDICSFSGAVAAVDDIFPRLVVPSIQWLFVG